MSLSSNIKRVFPIIYFVYMKSTSVYRRMLGYMLPYLPWLLISLGVSLFIVIFDAMSLWISTTLFSTLFNPDSLDIAKPAYKFANINEILKYWTAKLIKGESLMDSLKTACIVILVTFTLKNILTYFHGLLMAMLNMKIVRNMRNQAYTHALRLPVSFFDRNRSGDIVSLVLNDISIINNSLINTLPNLAVDPIRLIFFVGLLFVTSAKLTIGVFLIYPFFVYLIIYIGKTMRRRSRRVLNNFSGMVSVLSETVGCIRAVKMFNMNDVESRKFASENESFVKSDIRSQIMRLVNAPLTETLGVVGAVALLWYAGRQVLSGSTSFTAEEFVRYLVILVASFQPVKKLGNTNAFIQAGIAAGERVFKLLDTPAEPLKLFSENNVPVFSREIRFNDVRFSYPGCTDEVLKGVNFSVPRGSILAIVGSSGSGKSTILDLLPGFYNVTSGSITIDNLDIRKLDLTGLRSMFGIVSQETILFNDTVKNNILYGCPGADDDAVFAAAKAANALEFIKEMPKGMNTVIGEKGEMLSGGQRQRIAIARALLRNPPVLILDEATSSLDTESERLVQNAIDKVMENRTVVVVAHRLSTILHADQILVLEDGCIVQNGKHADLLSAGGRYRQLYDLQFGNDSHTSP